MRKQLKKLRRLAKCRFRDREQPLYRLRPLAAGASGGFARAFRELAVQTLIASTPTTFYNGIRSPDEPRILVLGNCQAPNLARHVASATDGAVIGVEMLNYTSYCRAFDALCEDADIILTQSLSERFASISTPALFEKYAATKKIITHTALHFSGEHPDMVYFGTMGRRIPSPIGDYHSSVILRSFLNGLSERDCLAAFTEETFARHGYFDMADASFREWEAREQTSDIRSAAFARSIWRDQQLMLTVNHPRSRLLKFVSDEFVQRLGLTPRDYDHEITPNLLNEGPIWPIHDLILKHHGKAHKTPALFWHRGRATTQEEFVFRSYAMYRKLGKDGLRAGATQEQIASLLGEP